MASEELKRFLQQLDEKYLDYAETLHSGGFVNEAEIAAAERDDLVGLNIRIGAAGRILRAARKLQEPGSSTTAAPPVREQIIDHLRKHLPSPSSYAKDSNSSGWSDAHFANLLPLMRTHRPAQLPVSTLERTFQQLPVALLDPILAQVEEDCAYAVPAAEDTHLATILMTAMSESFTAERARVKAFSDIMAEGLGIHFEQFMFRGCQTDGTVLVPGPSCNALCINLEVKLDIGTGGGDPRIQNSAHATLAMSEDSRRTLRAMCRCPVLLIELAGPNLSLSGYAFGQYACCDQLSQIVSLLWQPHSELMIGAARVICALRKACASLQAFYANLRSDPAPLEKEQQLKFPYPCSLPESSSHASCSFEYVEQLSDLTFLAKSDRGDPLFVKFCKRYSVEAHKEVQVAGYAPRLLGLRRLAGPWLMVVMEYLGNACSWAEAMDKPSSALHAAVAALHRANFVHGDLREPNVLVANEQVYLVDFEWAGLVGEARYPFYMNRVNVRWPDGASDGQPITKDHDLWWLRVLQAK